MFTLSDTSMKDMENKYFVYSFRTIGGVLLYVGIDKMEDIIKMRRLKTFSDFDPYEKIVIQVYEGYDERYKGQESVKKLKTMLGACKYERGEQVMCVETGQVFDTAYEACKFINTTPTRMSCHLKGRKGFKTIFGKTFKYI